MARLTKKIGLVLISSSAILAGCSDTVEPRRVAEDFQGGPSGSGALAGTGGVGASGVSTAHGYNNYSNVHSGYAPNNGGWFGGFFSGSRGNGSYGASTGNSSNGNAHSGSARGGFGASGHGGE